MLHTTADHAAPPPVLSHTTVMAAAAATPLSSQQIMGGVEANMAGVNSSYLGPLRSLLYSAKLSHVTQTRLSGGIGGGGRKTYSTPTPSRSHSVH